MARMAGRRALFAFPVLLIVTFGVFAVAAASPFDPVKAYTGTAGMTATQEDLDRIRANLGVDEPLVSRWWNWLTAALQGDLGDSSVLRQPVADAIGERVGWSVLLAVTAFALAVVLGTVLGVLAARSRGGLLDRTVSSAAYTLEAAPAFWLGLLVIWVFALRLGALPAGGLTDTGSDTVTFGQVATHLVLPATVLGITQMPWFFLYVRQGVGDALDEDPVRGARARGISERTVLLHHALRSGMLPMLTLIGSRVPELITGALLVETVFSWPGIAAATVSAATSVDFPLLAALTVLATAAVLIGNLLSDLLYGLADPRVGFDG
ncbi:MULTISPECIES: ABC transporter permease [Streptomyces]|uniref:ABC transporter permease n=1 Tax=Streptomyces tsukubensis (strain DSM 42081 / NBRC 108919 / NRRL 18488 / 9993) TaxID=1114943 RepID=A0A7G3UQ41_STRT9|nr:MULTISPECIES: ABC transporter permease [Streptomyces]AZK98192.1 ABC transporter permease [Streptomyces tsukubensis]MYS63987.1 ABC transporter permease subunit [Streptomyces sp. SID5473]QKM72058.1 ABC transporter permease [Streptomyces tsukubensis NRRL18488]TAI40674.1 ABC transporter permease [Streptomyces tsukubensis]